MAIDFRILVKDSVRNMTHPMHAIDAQFATSQFPSRFSIITSITEPTLSAIEAQEEKVLATMIPTKR